jgi:predicted transcriptional regulator YheO
MSGPTKGFNKRMSDTESIPEMNGTIAKLVELIATPMETPEKQAQALRESMKLQLHTYMMQKQLLTEMQKLLEERKSIIAKIIDRGLVPFLYFVAMSILWVIFSTFKP